MGVLSKHFIIIMFNMSIVRSSGMRVRCSNTMKINYRLHLIHEIHVTLGCGFLVDLSLKCESTICDVVKYNLSPY